MGFSYNVNVLNQKGSPAIYTDTFANRPAFGFAGRLFISNDTAAIYEDTGTAWVLIANVSSGAGTLQQVTTNGNTSNVGISVTAGGISTNSLTDTSLTQGSVPFVGAAGLITQDNANLFFDNTNNRLGINTNTPSNNLDVHGTGTSPLIAVNNTAGNQALISFLNTGAARWRIGNTAGNFFDIINMFTSTSAISINSAGNVVTLIGALNGTSCVFSSTITSQTNGSTFGNSAIGGNPLIVQANAVARAIQLLNTLGGAAEILCGGNATNSFIGFNTVLTSDAFVIYNDGSNRSNGDVGMWGASTRNLNFFDTTNNNINAQIQYSEINSNTGQLLFKTNNAGTSTTKLAILESGNVGIGTTTPSSGISSTETTLQIENSNVAALSLNNSSARKYTIYSGVGGQLAFYDSTASTERGRFTSDNNFLLNTTSTSTTNSSSFIFRSGSGAFSGVEIINHSSTNNATAGYIDCYYNTAYIGGIAGLTTSSIAFYTTSDYRLKEDFKEFNALNLICNIKVYDFKWKADENRHFGVIAHELQEIIPYVISGNKDELKEDGSIKVQVVDYSKIVPILIKSTQEQQTQIEKQNILIQSLIARIELLENK